MVDIAVGAFDGKSGLLSLTNERLFFLPDGNAESPSLEFRLTEVITVVYTAEAGPGVLSLKAASGESCKFTDVPQDDGQRMVDVWGSARGGRA